MPNQRSARLLVPHPTLPLQWPRNLIHVVALHPQSSPEVAAALAVFAASALTFVAPQAPPARGTLSGVQMQVGIWN